MRWRARDGGLFGYGVMIVGVVLSACGDVRGVNVESGHDASTDLGSDAQRSYPDVGADVRRDSADASSCASIAASLCAKIAACPLRAGFTQLCVAINPESVCVDTYSDCVAFFSACVRTSTPPVNELTIMPDPPACAAALSADLCVQMGQDRDFEVPQSCAVCPGPWQGLNLCFVNNGDAGDGG